MSTLLLLLFFLTTTIAPSFTIATHNLITKTCTNISSSDPNIHYNYCLTVLSSSNNHQPTTKPMNLRSLALLSTKITRSNATHTRTKIKKLLKSLVVEEDKYVKECLEVCLEVYSDALRNLKRSRKAIRRGRLVDANAWLSSVVDSGGTCDDGFDEKDGVANPLVRNDTDLFQLSVITLAIVNLL